MAQGLLTNAVRFGESTSPIVDRSNKDLDFFLSSKEVGNAPED
jgi:hypothetical protein